MSLSPSQATPPADDVPPPPRRGPSRRPLLVAAVVALVLAIVVIVVVSLNSGPAARPAAAPVSTTKAAPVDPCSRNRCAVLPNVIGMTAPQARDALTAAGFTVPGALIGLGDDSTVTSQTPGGLTKVLVVSSVSVGVYTPPAPARDISARDWALIAKSPDSHIGERIVVYGAVTQFDAATGTSTFRANVDGVVHKVRYGYADYETNTFLTGTSTLFAEVVTKDLFRAEATVTGSYSYTTTMGGTMTVPKLEVTAISVTGSTK